MWWPFKRQEPRPVDPVLDIDCVILTREEFWALTDRADRAGGFAIKIKLLQAEVDRLLRQAEDTQRQLVASRKMSKDLRIKLAEKRDHVDILRGLLNRPPDLSTAVDNVDPPSLPRR